MRAGTFITRIAATCSATKAPLPIMFPPAASVKGGREGSRFRGTPHSNLGSSSSGFNCAELGRRGTLGESRRNLIDRISALAACRNSLIGLPRSFVRIVVRHDRGRPACSTLASPGRYRYHDCYLDDRERRDHFVFLTLYPRNCATP